MPLNPGAKGQLAAVGVLIPGMGGVKADESGMTYYTDGGVTPHADSVAAANALPKQPGMLDEDVKFLVLSMVAGNTYAQAKAALLAQLQPASLQPSDACFAAYQALVTARAALYPATPYYCS